MTPADNKAPPRDLAALSEFESCRGATDPNPFWVLSDHDIPEALLVDF